MTAIETKSLTKRYKTVTAVENLCLRIEKGELFSLLGLNGAGKTTTIQMLSCLTKPSDGDAIVCGYSITKDCKRIKERIGVSPQETAVAHNLTVKENLELICDIHNFSKEKSENKIKELSQQFELNHILMQKASKLSGGLQRRVSIAMALIGEPELLFLDEPTLGLDVLARQELWKIIKQLKEHVTIILTTHYMEEAEALSDRIAIMKNGRLLALGTPEELKNKTHCIRFEDAFITIVKGEIE